LNENEFVAESHSVEIKTLYNLPSRFRLSDATQMTYLYDLVGFDQSIHPAPHRPTDPIFYFWTSHNARASSSNKKMGHVFPSRLMKVNQLEPAEGEDVLVGLQLWKTRCFKPRTDLLIYNLSKNKTYLLNNCISFLKSHYCDFSYSLESEDNDTMMT